MPNNRIKKKIFLWDRHICFNSLCSEMLEILSECGLEHCFSDLGTLNLAYLSDCMHSKTSKTWWDIIVLKPKLRTYITYKQSFKTEGLVLCNVYFKTPAHIVVTIPNGDSPAAY